MAIVSQVPRAVNWWGLAHDLPSLCQSSTTQQLQAGRCPWKLKLVSHDLGNRDFLNLLKQIMAMDKPPYFCGTPVTQKLGKQQPCISLSAIAQLSLQVRRVTVPQYVYFSIMAYYRVLLAIYIARL